VVWCGAALCAYLGNQRSTVGKEMSGFPRALFKSLPPNTAQHTQYMYNNKSTLKKESTTAESRFPLVKNSFIGVLGSFNSHNFEYCFILRVRVRFHLRLRFINGASELLNPDARLLRSYIGRRKRGLQLR
jgi:hypothetical protein